MAAPDPVLAEVMSLEERLLDPDVRADGREVQRLLHADFCEVGASGHTWDRDGVIAALTTVPEQTSSATDMSAYRVAEEVVLVTNLAGDSLRSSLWCRGQDGWRIRFHQGTPRAV